MVECEMLQAPIIGTWFQKGCPPCYRMNNLKMRKGKGSNLVNYRKVRDMFASFFIPTMRCVEIITVIPYANTSFTVLLT